MAQIPMTIPNERGHDERGLTLIETMIAAAILLIVVVGLLNLFTVAMTTNQLQGNLATRTTEYAQDKMEQLMAINYNDASTNTTVYPVTPTGGTGLTAGGSITIGAPVAGYVDYLDDTGNLLTGAAGASYTRQWMITISLTSPTLKRITVVVTSNVPGVVQGLAPSTTVTCYKSSGM
ncbi:MAG: prepilin-type N-terminal cleavage/methylation domain-containing protein [Terriglobia bacterium]